MPMSVLPTLQKKIRRAFFRLVLLFGGMSVLLMVGIFLAVRVPSLLMRLNYDSIAYAQQMEASFNTMLLDLLAAQGRSVRLSPESEQSFETALRQAAGNITESDEQAAVNAIADAWQNFARNTDVSKAEVLHKAIRKLVTVNERGMFRMLDDNTVFRDVVIALSALAFLLSTLWAFWLADGVVAPLSHPLRRAAEVFRQRPLLRRKLHLPDPQTLEVRILFDELSRLWERLSTVDALNVDSLLLEKRKLEVILESAEDAVLVLDGTGVVLHVSSHMVSLLGLPKEAILGQIWADLSTASPNYMLLRSVLAEQVLGISKQDIVLRVQEEEEVYTVRHRSLQGPDSSVVALTGGQGAGHRGGQVFLLSNVTEKRRREALRSEMMDWISHELKTPMQSLGLAADLLNQRAEHDSALCHDHEMRMLVDTVSQDVARLRIVARQFMDMARMSPLALQLVLEKVDLSQQLLDWLPPFRLMARELGIMLAVDIPETCPAVRVDTERFAWVVSNLVSNALRICGHGAHVELKLHVLHDSAGGGLALDVRDTGPGLSAHIAARLFQPYAHGRTAGSQEGLVGLGLAIAHTIVEAHGGVLSYVRENDITTFRVQLPLA
ncbi:MAG: ATP-binding protein [Desulfovibrionaceae bacterium]